MKCKFCDAELPEGSSICPACGRDNEAVEVAPIQQEPESDVPEDPQEEPGQVPEASENAEASSEDAPKMTPGKLALIIVLAVAAVALVVALIVASTSGGTFQPTSGTPATNPSGGDASTPTAEPTVPTDGNPEDVTCKGTYTVSDEELLATRDTVVATIGDAKLTVGQLQIYYWRAFYNFMNTYSNYSSYFGLDYTQPLDTQICSINNGTWQQYFLSSALSDWQRYQALSMEAAKNGFTLDAEYSSYLDELESSLNTSAQSYGFEDAAAMLQADMGAAATVEDYAMYLRLSYEGYQFFNEQLSDQQPTELEIATYYAKHAEEYAANNISEESGNYVNVRHILVQPEGGTLGEDGAMIWSDEAWTACQEEAQELLDQWLAGEHTEESFATLAGEKSVDNGSNSNGGLYANVTQGEMVEEFDAWCFDEARKVGDYGLVKTRFGYHIMYFSGSEAIWHATAYSDLMNERSSALIAAATEKYPMTVDYPSIVLGNVEQTSES